MGCEWHEISFVDLKNDITFDYFLSGVNVWVQRPHILNRKLTAVEIIETCFVNCKSSSYDRETVKEHVINLLRSDSNVSSEEVIASLQDDFKIDLCIDKNMIEIKRETFNNCDLMLQFRNLLPKNLSKFKNVFEILIIDKFETSLTFCVSKSDARQSAITPMFPYKVKQQYKRITLEIYSDVKEIDVMEDMSKEWLKMNVLPKIARWCQNPPSHKIVTSLGLVSAKAYNENYNILKSKYGKKLVQIWPECTDPLKFVYEDISIAAYLLSLWEKERDLLHLERKQSFVDLGCGNGLLVHILSSEGHKGIGIDLRKRNIWDLYGKETVLIESTATPSDNLLFPEYDWLIGNHSDELTPWIPVIAARSSYNMRAFLLPCCCFTFNGKYERTQSDCTKYQSYLLFIKDLCIAMGFEVQQDKLRIPSTKRVCILCSSRNYLKEEEALIETRRKEYIKLHSKKNETIVTSCSSDLFCNSRSINSHHDSGSVNSATKFCLNENNNNACWVQNFKPREKMEVVKNCTALDETFLKETVTKIANILLETDNYIELQTTFGLVKWNAGGKVTLPELVERVGKNTLQCLKNQCGGMQTLLRNYKNIFQTESGYVNLRVPSTDTHSHLPSCRKRTRRKTRQTKKSKAESHSGKACYFFFNHPQGCPLSSELCSYSHTIYCN